MKKSLMALDKPRAIAHSIHIIDEAIAEKRSRYLCRSPVLSDMPKSKTNNHHDLSDYISDAEPLLRRQDDLRRQYDDAASDARAVLAALPDGKAKSYLTAYFLQGREIAEIAAASGKSYHCVYMSIRRTLQRLQ